MKKITLFAAVALLSILSIQAQPKKGNWQEKMMSEKIAFITTELELTPEEAQVFWPVYNQLAKEKQETQKAVKESQKALRKALEEGTATDKEIDRLLDNYLAAKLANQTAGKGDADKYRKVLPSKKVAKLYIAEENFRRHHIKNIKGCHQGKGPGAGAGRPAGGQGAGKPGPRK